MVILTYLIVTTYLPGDQDQLDISLSNMVCNYTASFHDKMVGNHLKPNELMNQSIPVLVINFNTS